MGCFPSTFAPNEFDFPSPVNTFPGLEVTGVSCSHFYCLVQHAAEWSDYYHVIDCRSRSAYKKSHVVNSIHFTDIVDSFADKAREMTLVIYGDSPTSKNVTSTLERLREADAAPTATYLLTGSFSHFKSKYKVIFSDFTKTQGEQPGPLELIPATKSNVAVYVIHRNQFQHCKTTIAYLGCSTVINISSRRLFLKTAAINLENIQFDGANEPYDEALTTFMRYLKEKPKSATKGNILLIDETGNDYAALLAGWFWVTKQHDLEKVCEHLSNKMGEVDPWYLDVLRAWAEVPPGGGGDT